MIRLLFTLVKFRSTTLLVFLSILSFVLMGLTGGERMDGLRSAQDVVLSPFLKGLSSIARVGNLWRENRELRRRLAETEMERDLFVEAEAENDLLRKQLGFDSIPGYRLVPARIIGMDFDRFGGTAVIDRGRKHGVVPDLPVLSVEGLVGRVRTVASSTSLVFLLTNQKAPVGVRVDRSRVAGVLTWDPREGRLFLNNVPAREDVKAGDLLVTSGLGRLYPPGLRVGTVVRVEPEPTGLSLEVDVEPFARPATVENVFLLFPTGEHAQPDTVWEELR